MTAIVPFDQGKGGVLDFSVVADLLRQAWVFAVDTVSQTGKGILLHPWTIFFGTPAVVAPVLWKGWSFLTRYRYDGRWYGYIGVFPALWHPFRFCAVKFVRDPKNTKFIDAVRGMIEYGILKPKPAAPRRLDYAASPGTAKSTQTHMAPGATTGRPPQQTYETALEDYQAKLKEWTRERYDIIRKVIAREEDPEDGTGTVLRVDAETYRERKKDLPVVDVVNVAAIDKAHDEIERYFATTQQFSNRRLKKKNEFLTLLSLETGYLAPIFLISGLMTRFDNAWEPIITHYRAQLWRAANATSEAARPASFELSELMSFEFICWLLWGPSVSLCSCNRWACRARERDGDKPIFYQYGYGDENNSIDVRMLKGRSTFIDELRNLPGAELGRDVFAKPLSLIGKIGTRLPQEHVCPAQLVLSQEGERERIYLAYIDHAEIDMPEDASNYYSAYLWIMFVVHVRSADAVKGDGAAATLSSDKPWKNLLPFFEHVNIADASTFETLKEALVAKVRKALAGILRENPEIEIHYACAFDDSNCGHALLFPPQGNSVVTLLRYAADTAAPAPGVDPAAPTPGGQDDASILRDALASGRLRLDATPPPATTVRAPSRGTPSVNPFSSCELPDIVEAFYVDVRDSLAANVRQLAKASSSGR